MDNDVVKRIKIDFQIIWENLDLLAILLYGSYARNEEKEDSDKDICIVLGSEHIESKNVLSEVWKHTGDIYDVHIFETLPLRIQAEILDDYKIIFCSSPPELGEYFRPYYKKVNTWEHRLKVAYGDE